MKKILILGLAIILTACGSDNNSTSTLDIGDVKAIVATIDPGFVSGAHAAIGESSAGMTSLNDLSPTGSDVTVNSYGDYYYIIDRTGESISKFAFANPGEIIWQFTTKDNAEDTGSNPHAIVFVSEQKAYILRYGKTTAWIVDPSATVEADFKTGELDLASYASADQDGIPNMDNGVVVDGKLFITLQMLNVFSPTDTAYVAVFDTVDDTEIDTGMDVSEFVLKGIPLQVRNPFSDIVYESESGLIYIQATGDFFADFTGGVETLDPVDYSTSLLLDDGDNTSSPYGRITAFAIHSATNAYFVGLDGFDPITFASINNLYKMNPSTGEIVKSSIAAFEGIQITNIVIDELGRLWVSDATNATLHVVNSHTDEMMDVVSTGLNPSAVVFAP